MASPLTAALCAIVATAFWTLLGYALGRHLLPRVLALGAAPVMGWAVHSAAALPLFLLIGFSPAAVVGVGVICMAVAGFSLIGRSAMDDAEAAPTIPAWIYVCAAVLALVPALAILPKSTAAGVQLADPIFDHSKIAIIDAMTRQGLPPVNPVVGVAGAAFRLVYYYLWHFSAAEIALPLRASGWEADIGLTWFTAFASLTLMMGLAAWLSRRAAAAACVVVLAAATSLRAMLGLIFGSYELVPFLKPPNGFAGWLFQAAWVPQHLMAASCVVLAMLLIALYTERRGMALLIVLALTVVAGFESSTYVGGVTFAIAALAVAAILVAAIEPGGRSRFAFGLALAAAIAVCIAAPFISDQFALVAARGGGTPIVIRHFQVLGEMFPETLRRVLDLPAYWLVKLPIEFPATYIAGAVAFLVMLQSPVIGATKTAAMAFASLAGAALVVSWLLVSTLGDNNDLGLRAVLPAAMVLIVAAAAGLMLFPRHVVILVTALGGLTLSLPDTVKMIRSNAVGTPQLDAKIFAQTPELWDAVRRYAGPAARVANNPLFLQDLTPWPANMSWALLANRNSCFAGRELALAFAPLPADRREAINTQFIRAFAGEGTSKDVEDMAKKYGCDVAVVVAQDKAWSKDPFASNPNYKLAESWDGGWRIYLRR
jgi:hypothetical protein